MSEDEDGLGRAGVSAAGWPMSEGVAFVSGAAWSEAGLAEPVVAGGDGEGGERYRRVSLLGEGGMGEVWLGWDARLERNVAIKQPKGGLGSPEARRLTHEAMITARLEHPNIVSVHDMYTHDGRPHFVMRLVRGEPLGRLVARREEAPERLPILELRHLLDAAEAVGHAHRVGVVHRDLSPMNVLVAEDGGAHVIDWGLARCVDDLEGIAGGAGTPGYMAPEARASGVGGVQGDVWSLGALLHLVVYGHAPGKVVTSLSESSWPELHSIIECALHEDLGARYGDAGEMARDLQSWFEGQRVRAYHVTPWRLARRVIRVYRGRLVVAAALALAFAAVAVVGVVRTRQETKRALAAEALAVEREVQARRDSSAARRAAARSIYEEASDHARRQANVDARRLAIESLGYEDNPDARGLLAALAARPEPRLAVLHVLPECPLRGWSLLPERGSALCHGEGSAQNATLARAWRGGGWGWELKRGGEQDASCSFDGVVGVGERLLGNSGAHPACSFGALELDPRTGEVVSRDRRRGNLLVSGGALRAPVTQQRLFDVSGTSGLCAGKIMNAAEGVGGRIWVICDSYEVWRSGRGGVFERLPVSTDDEAHSVAFSGEGGEAWFASSQGRLFAFDGAHRSWEFGASVAEMAFLPGSPLLAILGLDGSLRVFDTSRRVWRVTMPGRYSDVRVEEGLVLRAIRRDRQVLEWTFDARPRIARYHGAAGFAMAAWSRDQSLVVGVDGRGYAHAFAPFEGRSWEPVAWNKAVGKWVSASPTSDGFHLVGIGSKGVHTASVREGEFEVELDPRYDARVSYRSRAMAAPDGRMLYVLYGREDVDVEPPGGGLVRFKTNFGGSPVDADTSSRHGKVAFASDRNVTVWDWSSEEPALVWSEGARAVSVNEEGEVLVVAGDEVVALGESGLEIGRWEVGESAALDVEWVPGSARAVLGHLDGSMTLWDVGEGRLIARGRRHEERVTKVDVTRDGRWLVTTSWDGTLALWDLEVAARDLQALRTQ